MAGYAFVSYAREDFEYVERLVSHLNRNGIQTWHDRHVEHGSRWDRTIEAKLVGCSALVPVLTSASRASDWCVNEFDFAMEQDKPIFPLLFEGKIWLQLRRLQYDDVTRGGMPGVE